MVEVESKKPRHLYSKGVTTGINESWIRGDLKATIIQPPNRLSVRRSRRDSRHVMTQRLKIGDGRVVVCVFKGHRVRNQLVVKARMGHGCSCRSLDS
jgi:hypothetical protein